MATFNFHALKVSDTTLDKG